MGKSFCFESLSIQIKSKSGKVTLWGHFGAPLSGASKRNRRKLTKIDRKRMLWFPVLCKGCSGRLKSHSKSTTLSLKLSSGSSRETIDLLFASGATNQQLGGARFFCGLAFFSSCTCEPKLSTSLRQGCAFWTAVTVDCNSHYPQSLSTTGRRFRNRISDCRSDAGHGRSCSGRESCKRCFYERWYMEL